MKRLTPDDITKVIATVRKDNEESTKSSTEKLAKCYQVLDVLNDLQYIFRPIFARKMSEVRVSSYLDSIVVGVELSHLREMTPMLRFLRSRGLKLNKVEVVQGAPQWKFDGFTIYSKFTDEGECKLVKVETKYISIDKYKFVCGEKEAAPDAS